MDGRAAFDLIRERGGEELAERLVHLDRIRTARPVDAPLERPDATTRSDTDVVFLGGGLSLLIAAELARLGVEVVVIERARAGRGHREWNASAPELAALVEGQLVSATELDELVVARYREGRCHFYGGTPHVVTGVLDHAVDAGALLERVRAVAAARGVRFVDHATVTGLGLGDRGVRVEWNTKNDRESLVAQLAVDARGASSPYASADLVCPTVGGVMSGLRFDPTIGEVLVTTEDADDGCQHVWEGFPGRAGELTVYLFYYAASAGRRTALMPLYARFFERLGAYKDGVPALQRPTFGFIPGWSRLAPAPAGPSSRVVLVGDAAARHSPLTFCGFGSMLRTFRPVAASLADAIDRRRAPALPLADDSIHTWTGLLARLMASRALRDSAMNSLLDDAFASLASLGNGPFAALLQDRMRASDYVAFLRRTALRHPSVFAEVLRALGPWELARWSGRLARGALGRRLPRLRAPSSSFVEQGSSQADR